MPLEEQEVFDEFDHLADDELLKKIDESAALRDLEQHQGWKLLNAGCRRLVIWAQDALSKVPADQTVKIIELQQIIKLYRDIIPNMRNSLKDTGKLAFQEAKRRGVIEKVLKLIR